MKLLGKCSSSITNNEMQKVLQKHLKYYIPFVKKGDGDENTSIGPWNKECQSSIHLLCTPGRLPSSSSCLCLTNPAVDSQVPEMKDSKIATMQETLCICRFNFISVLYYPLSR